ncbi:MAG TPA: NYN domain-containing protein [Calditerricola sp.]
MERVMIFIDGNNFYHTCRHYLQQNPKVDLEKLAHLLVNKRPGRHLMRTYFYTVDEPQQQGIITALKYKPRFLVVTGKLVKHPIHGHTLDPTNPSTYFAEEKGTDVNLTTDMIVGAYMNSYDTAVLLSADSDYKRVIEEVRKTGKIVEIALPEGQRSELKKYADEVIEINEDDFRRCWIGPYVSQISP